MAKKKRTFGVSPKGALVLREREQERRANLPRVAVKPDGAAYRLPQNPLVALMQEFPLLTADIKGNWMPVPEIWPGTAVVVEVPKCIEVAINMSHLNDLPICLPINLPEPKPGIPPTITHTFVETDHSESPVHRFFERWWPELGMPFDIRPESEISDRKKYKMRKVDARAVVVPTDNNYRDFHDVVTSWYAKDAKPLEYRLYTAETKICNSLERLLNYFAEYKERTKTRLSGLEVVIDLHWAKLLVTEVYYHDQAMLLLEVVHNHPGMRPMGFVRYFKESGTLKARNDSEHDISWTFNTFFSDFDVFGRGQLDQFLDIVVYCLDQGLVKEYISYYG